MLRIVFSIAFCQQHLPVRLVSATTKSRWKFYAQVQRLSFHTAWVNRVGFTVGLSLPIFPD
jgi:hypothetical protein